MDLTEVEGLADLLNAETSVQRKQARIDSIPYSYKCVSQYVYRCVCMYVCMYDVPMPGPAPDGWILASYF